MSPYKVVPYEPGAADVIDRQTGEKVGYVLLWWRGWFAYLASDPGRALVFDDDRRFTRYRRGAAEKVWTAHTEATA